ncbi:Zinc finger BED domain-containing protein DAYSLEEPER [Linum perenne]
MATPEENAQLKDHSAATEETSFPAPKEESQSVAAPEEKKQSLSSPDTAIIPQEENNQKVVPQKENNQDAVSQKDNKKMESPEDRNEVLSKEENNQGVASQEDNDKMETQEESNQVLVEEDNNQKLVSGEDSNRTCVSQEQVNQTLPAPEDKNQGLMSNQENSQVLASHVENSPVLVSQEEGSQKTFQPQENNPTLIPEEDNNEVVLTEEDSVMEEPQQDSQIKVPQESSQVEVQQETSQIVVLDGGSSQVMEPREDSIKVVVPRDASSQMAEPEEESSQVTVLLENSQMVGGEGENQKMVPEEHNSQIALPQETSPMEVSQDNTHLVVPKEEKVQMLVPKDTEQVDVPEENNQMAAPLENSLSEVPREENSQFAVPQEESSQLVVPQEDNSQMLVSHEDNSQVVVPHEENSQMMLPHEDNTQMMLSHEHNIQMLAPHDDNTQMMPSHEHDTNMLAPHEDNAQMLVSHEENTELLGNHHMGNQLMVMDEDNNQLMITHDENNQLVLTHEENNELMTPDMQPNKRRRKKSVVWEHFTIETVGDGCRRACCKQCKQSFAYSTGSKVAGTSHLKRHIAKGTCLALLRNQGHQMLTYTPGTGGNGGTNETPKRRYRSPSTSYFPFDSDRCRHEIAKMIIMHDYPLHMVEHAGFVTFVQNLQPRFGMVSFNSVQGDCVATYLREKQNVMKFIEGLPGRVSLTLDMWTSSESIGYVFITGHFIDTDWKPQKRLLNVEMEPYPDSDAALSHAVACSLSDWSLEGKLFSVAFNHLVGEPGFESLRSLLCIKNTSILNGQLVLGNCISHTLTSMAKDVMCACRDLITKIRDSVKYVKTLESNEEKFLELKQQLQVPTDKNLRLDDQTQWNTTYEMLLAASELKEVFSCLDTSDPHYKEAPSMLEWKQVETICSILKHLVDAANILGVSTSPISITFFHEAWRIQAELSRLAATGDPFVNSFIKGLQDKIEKYVKDCSLVLAIAVVMDPRFKMKLVEFSFSKIYGDDAPTYIKIVDDGVHELFQEYVSLPLPLTPTYEDNGNNMNGEENQRTVVDNGLADFDMYIMETTSHQTKSELDMYLDDSLLPRLPDFDVLSWWRQNKMKYPTLSKMARDILSIPVSTASAENVFDTVLPRQLDQYRSSLRPETVEALVCAKDWLKHGSSEAAASDGVVKMEF